MKVHIKFLATIREITGEPEIELEIHSGDTVEAVMSTLEHRYGIELKEATTGTTAGGIPKIRILVNGRDMEFLSGLETELKAGDVMVLIPPVAGG
ncbi:molybdopterin converting factor [Methanosarcina sp. 1.H.T.1A.1]|uniref:ubiquitin-like small modifier protein 1 n=1 Tax=Methanosarcina sp. 1.H.T.1A.1 TaxID=1483602 RepID=UPI000621688A|nr:ubiquitin-like small modifier protein 1 [Methanosarcina sp. 1.H.T.1A.1]KKI00473.1 molybdopterin converting factor [Methanosarcina sp. 1.H.T.1A.1]